MICFYENYNLKSIVYIKKYGCYYLKKSSLI